ncbi:Intradiol ring-cleavage dioxygenase [Rhypophila decipiens]|uniref:Intradiol ring-cleavage dioxygenase n=1 Tax=Rhypophila decipiens TaxID=261697 RepID=A0AAN6Y034_9PEZI|nr:Intradiol ring-cleavage dioxygenase [Rhypophila decipiens]
MIMIMLPSLIVTLAIVPFISITACHPASHSDAEIQAELHLRHIVIQRSKQTLAKCSNSAAARAVGEEAIVRRAATAHTLRQQRGLQNDNILARRDKDSLLKWSSLSHSSPNQFSLSTDPSEIFSSNTTCALVPQTAIGPYYVSGELLRTNLTDSQPGIPIHLDMQFISTSNCLPVPESSPLLVDIWHCNSAGVYSGVSAPGQGGISSTHGRGVQQTDSDGVVQFGTLFPGHYAGRATHIHLMATSEVTLLPNNTFTGGKARHIGQLYFDQELVDEVESLSPYRENTQALVRNEDDGLAAVQATREYDPFMNYVFLGDKLEDGLLMWITIGIDLEADYSGRVFVAETFTGRGGDEEGTRTVDGVVSTSSSAAAMGRFGAMTMGWGWRLGL